MSFDLPDDYVDVAERIREFREKHPQGSLQQRDLQFVAFGGKEWVVYTAAAYRSEDDQRPGEGTAWEPVPGKTPFTRDSELQNAETAAWGRAIVAVLAADTKRVASADEVRNRRADDAAPGPTQAQIDAQATADGLPGCDDPARLNAVRAWSDERRLMDESVTDEQGASVTLGALFARHAQRLEGVPA